MSFPRLAVFGLIVVACQLASGHEVDQYVLPEGEEFEDLGDHWNEIFDTAVCKGIASLNREIELANSIPIPAIRELMLAKCHSPGTVAWRVRKHLPVGLLAIAELELELATDAIPRRHCDRIQSFRASTFSTIYSHFSWLPDPRQLGRMTVMRSSVIKVHDTYIGTDKIGHFIGHGYAYFLTYRGSLNLGSSCEDAMRHAVNVGSFGPISENGLVGIIPTGVFSNADQAANYLGMKFFINLTEPVQLKGCIYPAMLQRDGDYWVKRSGLDEQYHAAFVSEHLDEVLNPGVYGWEMRDQVREQVQGRAEQLLDWYARNDPSKRNRAYFDRINERCTTYFGEDYGYSGNEDEIITLGDICFEDQPADDDQSTHARLATSSNTDRADFFVEVATPFVHRLGESEAYEIVVRSKHTDDFENVAIVAQIPRGVHVTTLAQPGRFDREASTLTWEVPNFEAESQHTFLFIAKAVKEGTYSPEVIVRDWSQKFASKTYAVNVSSSATEVFAIDVGRDGATVEENAAGKVHQLEVDILGPSTHQLGKSEVYEVTVFNAAETELENAAIALELPRGLRVTRLSQQATLDAQAGRLTWQLPYVEPRTEYVLRFTAKAFANEVDAPRLVVLNQSKPVAVAAFQAGTVSESRATR